MKTRQGFISNSSSSSFICCVCERIESGADLSYDDVEMAECENEHCFCQDHIIDKDKWSKYLELSEEVNLCEISTEYCPICQFEIASEKEQLKYFLKKNELTEKTLMNKIRKEFKTHKEFSEYLKS